ncbi:hypothetical protein SAMN05216505_112143 [Streptomyces prasinopilosus]|uniref:Uncharacterized protein n=1 Tax=Streptomyces prasinopilosus TaxID=67344 RepID=A0A1G6Y184_9ACTN|nr:hypothetical protein [Streptomyces prasinopilosus]SDD83693.1 hypothetical protein SAMN05216505_112143 [Streptomyces prasinopilosus]
MTIGKPRCALHRRPAHLPRNCLRRTVRHGTERAATALSIASVASEVCMWSAIGRPTTFLEQRSITVARESQDGPTIMEVMAPHYPGVRGVRGEAAHHRVRRGPVRDRRPLLRPQVPADDVVDPHINRVTRLRLVGPAPSRPQLGMDARDTVDAMALGVKGADLARGPLLLGPALDAGLLDGQAPVVAGPGLPEHLADPLTPKSVRLSEMRAQRRGLTSPPRGSSTRMHWTCRGWPISFRTGCLSRNSG